MRHLARLLKLKLEFRDKFTEQVEADYEQMQAPEYAKLARKAERAMPPPRFRKFGKPRDES